MRNQATERSGRLRNDLTVSPDGGGAAIPHDGQWHAVRFAGYCPAGTTTLRLDLRNAGGGPLLVADPELRVMSPPP